VYVQIAEGANELHVEVREWEWAELDGQSEALELVIDRARLLYLKA
jgi:hypothetical protein